MTLFLYIDLYFVLLFLSFPLPSCVCDTRGKSTLLGVNVMGYGQTAGGCQPRESMCMLERMGLLWETGVRMRVDCKLKIVR